MNSFSIHQPPPSTLSHATCCFLLGGSMLSLPLWCSDPAAAGHYYGFEEECGSLFVPLSLLKGIPPPFPSPPLHFTPHTLSSQQDPCCPSGDAPYTLPAPLRPYSRGAAVEWQVALRGGLSRETPLPLRSKALRNSWGVSCFDTVCMFF